MTDRSIVRFPASDIAFIADVLRGAYAIAQTVNPDDTDVLMLGDFIEALESDDCIEIVDDEDMLIVED